MNSDVILAQQIAAEISRNKGTAYYVGGYVRDKLLNRANKDIDIEVHGIFPDTLESILKLFGEFELTGVSFGVYRMKRSDIEIALPRTELQTGEKHTDFQIHVDPFLGTYNAARRRDFTMNALMENVVTGEIIDHFNGINDLRKGIIRHINDTTFAEDPLRVLRAAQFAARFGYQVDFNTIELCKTMKLNSLAKERIFEELKKAMLKSERPSVFFETLRKMNQLSHWFPEVKNLIGIQQEPKYHPEGDVWNHTMLALDAAAALRHQASFPLPYMLAVLCHDLGKFDSTQIINGVIRSFNHELTGIPLAERFLKRLTADRKLINYVKNQVELHMRPNLMAEMDSGKKAYAKMFDKSICPADLLLVAEADRLGQLIESDYTQKKNTLKEMLNYYEEIMQLPYVTGRDLVDAGMTPGIEFSKGLEFAHKLRLSAVPKDTALKQTLGYIRSESK